MPRQEAKRKKPNVSEKNRRKKAADFVRLCVVLKRRRGKSQSKKSSCSMGTASSACVLLLRDPILFLFSSLFTRILSSLSKIRVQRPLFLLSCVSSALYLASHSQPESFRFYYHSWNSWATTVTGHIDPH